MSLLLKIIKDFDEHLKFYEFIIELENDKIIKFNFKKEHIKHLLGLHKTLFNKFYATFIYKKIKQGHITFEKLKKDKNFSDIETRVLKFSRIKDLLNLNPGDEIIEFNSSLLTNCNLKSEYIIFNKNTGGTLHLGLAKGSKKYYPETWFIRENKNSDKYIKGQKKIKIRNFKKIKK